MPAPEINVTELRNHALSGAEALRQAILTLLRAKPCKIEGEVRLRLTIDALGKVVAVDVLSGPVRSAQCLKARLLGMATAARARGQKSATIDLSFRNPPITL